MQAEPIVRLTRAQKIASGEPKPLAGTNRKAARAAAMRESRAQMYYAYLRNYPTSPRKMRLVADMIRDQSVERALAILKLHPRHAAQPLLRLLGTAIDSFETKSGQRASDVPLYVQTITVDGGAMLKRLRTAPQGRAHRIRKRSNHVFIRLNVRSQENAGTNTNTATRRVNRVPAGQPQINQAQATA